MDKKEPSLLVHGDQCTRAGFGVADRVLSPLLLQRACFLTGDRSLFPWCQPVQGGVNPRFYTDLLCEEESQLSHVEMVAVTDGSNTFFSTDLGHALITDGGGGHNLPDVAAPRPAPPPRDHSMDHKLTNSLDLLIGPDSRADIDSEYTDTLNNSKNRSFLKADLNCSEESLSTHESDGGVGGAWQSAAYGARASRHSQTLKAHHHHPSGVSSETELDAQYAQIKETNEYMEAPSMTRLRKHRRHDKTPMHQPSFSETDSSGSSEGSAGGAGGGGAARAHGRRRTHAHHAHRHYKKRSLGNLVAVQSPRVPKLGMFVGPPELPTGYRARTQEDKASESSDGSSEGGGDVRRTRPVTHAHAHHDTAAYKYTPPPQDNSSSSAADSRRRQKNAAQVANTTVAQNWGPQGSHGVPLFVEKCVQFIEREGLASEGLYRVPGNRAHIPTWIWTR
ncbi:unnamed protein product [Leptidea sinapis]|uniref:Rho-GAP domain-containing protein n=1 Tax=Leptidea sinapis TaxID=189913 RepID=A0A5E4PU32_9NEOP|nr:unnamed protein product [Leptidea sinapis]